MIIDLSGQQFGRYRLVRCLGYGGFASVYLGQHVLITSQQAAVKLLHMSDVNAQHFMHEANTTASLAHPHIVRLLDFDIQQDIPYLVLDYAPNGSLLQRHPKGEQLPLATIVQYVKDIATALHYAHEKNIIHRDIKPENILVGRHGEVLLSDFGIALLSQTGRTSLETGYGEAGTSYYMAPEMFRGKPEKASDQYSLAVMVYEWLCGELPFTEGNKIQLGYQHNYEAVPSLREKLPGLSERVEAVVMQALAKNSNERFATVQVMAEKLEEAHKTPWIDKTYASQVARKITPEQTEIARSFSFASDKSPLGTTLLTYSGHSTYVCRLAWSPDGLRIASGSGDKTVQVWEGSSGRCLLTYRGHSDEVRMLAWSPDGSHIASGSDNTVQVWEAE